MDALDLEVIPGSHPSESWPPTVPPRRLDYTSGRRMLLVEEVRHTTGCTKPEAIAGVLLYERDVAELEAARAGVRRLPPKLAGRPKVGHGKRKRKRR